MSLTGDLVPPVESYGWQPKCFLLLFVGFLLLINGLLAPAQIARMEVCRNLRIRMSRWGLTRGSSEKKRILPPKREHEVQSLHPEDPHATGTKPMRPRLLNLCSAAWEPDSWAHGLQLLKPLHPNAAPETKKALGEKPVVTFRETTPRLTTGEKPV